MTETERVQLEKDILYEHHKAEADFNAQLVKLKQSQSRIEQAAGKLGIFLSYVEIAQTLKQEGAPSASLPDVDMKQIERECGELLTLREKVDRLQSNKKRLGL